MVSPSTRKVARWGGVTVSIGQFCCHILAAPLSLKAESRNDFRALEAAGRLIVALMRLSIASAISPQTAGRKTVCVKSWLPWRWLFAPVHRAPKQEPTIITTSILLTDIRLPGSPLRGAGGTCALKSAVIPARSTTLPDLGLITASAPAAPQSGPSSYGVTTWAKLLVRRMVSGSCRAAMMTVRFGHVRDHWRVAFRRAYAAF
jgi:hypothetical protein